MIMSDVPEIVGIVRYAAYRIGWAIGVHGSLVRDIDLIAVPWRDNPCTPEDLVMAIKMATGYESHGHPLGQPRAGGRRTILLMAKDATFIQTPKGTWTPPCIDLSIMPDYRNHCPPNTDVWVLTYEANEPNQLGKYLEAVFDGKPDGSDIHEATGLRLSACASLINSGVFVDGDLDKYELKPADAVVCASSSGRSLIREAAEACGPKMDQDLFWQLLRTLEEHLGKRAGALDADLIRQAYRHFNKVTGSKHVPSYIAAECGKGHGTPIPDIKEQPDGSFLIVYQDAAAECGKDKQ
jgi:hypothetical protein